MKATAESNNHMIERLITVLDALHKLPPVNLYSTLIVIAPKSSHNRWQFAVRETKRIFHKAKQPSARQWMIVDLDKFEALCPSFDDQFIFVVDDTLEDAYRKRLLTAIKTLNLDHGHRLFMTQVNSSFAN